MLKRVLVAAAAAALLVASGASPAHAAGGVTCTPTSPASSAAPSPGQPCWTQANPYPFGFDGNPVDPNSTACQEFVLVTGAGGPAVCYLAVTSMAFRAWNRGLAAVTEPAVSNAPGTTSYGVWLYNGTRWYPDPTFPGSSVCRGDTILWAGKLDYWLIGSQPGSSHTGWPALCRFDGANFDWEPLPVPQAAIPYVASLGEQPTTGSVNAGGCLAWNDCWFFGSYGITLHWDGQTLTPGALGPGGAPWLQSNFTSAVVGTDAGGNPFGIAAAEPSASTQPSGAPAPQLFASSGGPFAPLDSSAAVLQPSGDQTPVNPVAFAANATGDVWTAGNPSGHLTAPEPAPVQKISPAGDALSCPGASAANFTYQSPQPGSTIQYSWSGVAVFPDGDALAGGDVVPPSGSATSQVPALADVSCDGQPATTELTGVGPGSVTAVAANASNDGWAAVASGGAPDLFHLTDGQTPNAPAGDDNEARPQVITGQQATLFVNPPPIVIPAPPLPTTTTKRPPPRKVKLKSAIYAVKPKLEHVGKGYILSIAFKVRRAVIIGAEALEHKRVVSSSGLKHFRPPRGVLILKLQRDAWPTGIKFVLPKSGK